MKDILSQLLKLQRLDMSIRTLGHDLQQIPKKKKMIDEKVGSVREPFELAKMEREGLEAERLALEETLKSLDERERDLKLKMPDIRSNEEYSALLKEMDAVKKAKDDAENHSLKDMEHTEQLDLELPPLEAAFLEGEKTVAGERKALSNEQENLESELLAKKKERQSLQKEMDPVWFHKYTHISAKRNGLAVVAVNAETCQGCFIGVRPKLIQDLRYAEEVVFCEGCQRILYLDDA